MSKPLRCLIVEDSPEQAQLVIHELNAGGYELVHERVDSAEAMIAALERQSWDIIISDHYMPDFSSMDALDILQGKELDLPFIIVSGHISEEEAVAAMKAGAHDYVMKGKLARLVPAVERELKEAEVRRQRKRSEALYHSLVENLPQNVFCKDASGRFTFANQRFCRALGKPLSEIIGKTDTDLFPSALAQKHEQDDANILQTGQILETVEEHQTPDQKKIYVEVIKTPLRDARGKIVGLQGIYTDITGRKQAEEAIRASLEEKIVLLKEVHHRVKNNLQIVISLLRLQAVRTKNPEALETFQETGNRIHSMALLHEALYRSQSLAHVNFADYIDSLCSHIFRSHAQKAVRVKLERRLQNVSMDLDRAVLCGLIVNELVTNALKHAFPENRNGRIAVELETTPQEQILLKVSDDGVGLPWGLNLRQAKTLGHQLVFMLTEKLRATMDVTRDHGTSFCITFQSKPPEDHMNKVVAAINLPPGT